MSWVTTKELIEGSTPPVSVPEARILYDWLGWQVTVAIRESVTSGAVWAETGGPELMARARAFQEVREHMRQSDSSLPYLPLIDGDQGPGEARPAS